MPNNEGSSGEDSLKKEEAERVYSSVEESFSTSDLSFVCTFYNWYVLKKKQSFKTLLFSFYIFFLHFYKTTCR